MTKHYAVFKLDDGGYSVVNNGPLAYVDTLETAALFASAPAYREALEKINALICAPHWTAERKEQVALFVGRAIPLKVKVTPTP